MKFNSILVEQYKRMCTKAIRIKIDPRNESHADYSKAQGYEGWIIEEDDGQMQVFVADLDDLMTAPMSIGDPYTSDLLDEFKEYIITSALQNKELEDNSPVIDYIIKCADSAELEQILKNDLSYGEDDVINFYRGFINGDGMSCGEE